jgi:phytoene dehydrogenase-like protein
MSAARPVIVVGGGLAGLACARRLAAAGIGVRLFERADAVGGRVRTDLVRGFRLDRGFQVLLTAYPEARHALDYDALGLRAFYPGALVWTGRRFARVADPFRHPLDAAASLGNGVGTAVDKLRVLSLRRRARAGTLATVFTRPQTSVAARLEDERFSDGMLRRFFRPFLGGIFLDPDLGVSSRLLDFVFRMLAEGAISVPARGMGEIAEQLAAHLGPGGVRLHTEVVAVDGAGVTLKGGERVEAAAVVVATEGDIAARLLGRPVPTRFRSVTSLYFAAPRSPVGGPYLVLDGTGIGPVNNLAVMSDVAPEYAPAGQALISTAVLGLPAADDAALEAAVRAQLRRWYGVQVDAWEHLRTYRIRWAHPDQSPAAHEPASRPVRLGERLYAAGDQLENASIHGALRAGRRAAEALAAELA